MNDIDLNLPVFDKMYEIERDLEKKQTRLRIASSFGKGASFNIQCIVQHRKHGQILGICYRPKIIRKGLKFGPFFRAKNMPVCEEKERSMKKMAFFKHNYEVRELIRRVDNGWSSWNVKYIGNDEHEANRIYKTLKKENPEKEYELEDYVSF